MNIDTLSGWSHPGKKLKDHLKGVQQIAQNIMVFHGLNLDLDAILLTHDIAKEHPRFQKQLIQERKGFSHAAPSSFFTLHQTKDWIAAEIVRNHHGSFSNISQVAAYWSDQEQEDVHRSMDEILHGYRFSQEEWERFQDQWIFMEPDANQWHQARLQASILITADRMDAMNLTTVHYRFPEKKRNREEYLKDRSEQPLNEWRNTVGAEVLDKASVMKPGEIYTLSLPTGAGKTLLGIELAQRLHPKTILYVLPFISIIEQTAAIAEELFDCVQQDHHLIAWPQIENPLTSFVSAFRYWIDPVVITTLAHLWDVFYSPRMNDMMNYHRFQDALVILDEAQSIPVSYWKGLGQTLQWLSKKMNTTFILMTATQPFLGTPSGKESELSGIPAFPRKRHQYHLLSKMPLQELPTILPTKGSGLIIQNNRKAALVSFRVTQEASNLPLLFLSRWVIPKERGRIVQKARQLLNQGEEFLMVSTQVVEAGVDLDFHWVIRDLAPLDSLVQAAGRCNRNLNQEVGEIWIPEFIDDQGKRLSTHVYDAIRMSATCSVLREAFDDRDVPSMIQEYYRILETSIHQKGPWYDLIKGNWGERYDLIEKDYPQMLVLVDFDGSIRARYMEWAEMPRSLNLLEARRQIWKDLQQSAIEAPIEMVQQWMAESGSFMIDDDLPQIEMLQGNIGIVNPTGIGEIYIEDSGFQPPLIQELTEY